MEINAPISEVFTYFARPEHMADQFPENMGLMYIPVEVKNGLGWHYFQIREILMVKSFEGLRNY